MEFKAYHKIRQFRDIVRDINHKANFKGFDENNNPIYEESTKPILKFIGTVKLHGTNAGVCYTPNEGVVAQKRKSLLRVDELNTHMNFNAFVKVEHKAFFENLMKDLWELCCVSNEQIILYGEWAGEGIQKGVAISSLKKSFYVFGCKVFNKETDENKWIDTSKLRFDNDRVYNINQFQTFEIDIDFNNPGFSQNKLIEITNSVEKECPVSKELGISGIGEGVVWTSFWNGEKYIFKVKGEKHSTSKVKTLASINPEILKNINDFVEYSCTINRINQGIKEVNAIDKKDMPNLLKWVSNDIITEESDVLANSGLEWKNVAKECNNRVRQIFFSKLDSF